MNDIIQFPKLPRHSKMSDTAFIDFDSSMPNLAQVDVLLGGVGRIVIEDGIEQIANFDEDTGKLYCYSPALTIANLENFVKENMHIYEEINDLHRSAFDEGNNVEIFPFWDESQSWANHKMISHQPYVLKQMLYDVKSLIQNRELSSNLVTGENQCFILKIDQRTNFGDMFMPIFWAPFHLKIESNPKAYKVEVVWFAPENPSKFSFDINIQPYLFEGYQNVEKGTVFRTLFNASEVYSELTQLLDGYNLIGILESE